MEAIRYPEHMVFGLDIGTRSIVGTVGYKEKNNNFIVVAQYVKEHETRAMLDGQIHDINRVSQSILTVKKELEQQIGRRLTDVCIAAAGRVLKTVTVKVDYVFPIETVVTDEHIYTLELLGIEKAYDNLKAELKEENINFYCVGYSVIRNALNDFQISRLEGHKATKITTELVATFLPDDVIDGLYTAVERAGLQVANLTLEPIAAINVAIPEKFRLLNIAMVDVGAGTSDISITKDGSIIAYGMIPSAGDELTEPLVPKYLVDFAMAERMKMACIDQKEVTYQDILGISHTIETSEVIEAIQEILQRMTKSIADKILELNGGKPVNAVFVVGGGGKLPSFITLLAQYLDLPNERVALRGEEVLQEITFMQENIKKDPLLVTPIGICLNYYEEKNNFIFVVVNGERVKLYDNNKLTIVDAVTQYGLTNEFLFPRRGKSIIFTLNGNKRMTRGEQGEAAIVKLNGELVGINHGIKLNDRIEITNSTIGKDATLQIKQLQEFYSTISFQFNGKTIVCPKYAMADDNLVSEYYEIQEGDNIQVLNYYTLAQVLEFMDVVVTGTVLVNHRPADLDEKIFENFSIQSNLSEEEQKFYDSNSYETEHESESYDDLEFTSEVQGENEIRKAVPYASFKAELEHRIGSQNTISEIKDITVLINGEYCKLSNRKKYIFVDIFDFYPFDLKKINGSKLIITLNGETVDYTAQLKDQDVISLYWEQEDKKQEIEE